jgi:hypothetical protein
MPRRKSAFNFLIFLVFLVFFEANFLKDYTLLNLINKYNVFYRV